MHSFLMLCILLIQILGQIKMQAHREGEEKGKSKIQMHGQNSRPRVARKISRPPGGIDFTNAVLDEKTGFKCVMKTEEVETVEKEPILSCVHKNVEKCHYSYITQFTPSQEQKCEENYQKSCHISFQKKAQNETIRKCYRPVEKVCNGEGAEECHRVYETSCSTRYVEASPGSYVAETQCEKLPVKMCGAGCVFKEGGEECHDKLIATVLEVPEEQCDLSPQKTCRLVTKLVPSLKPSPQCTVIPQEVCTLKSSAPRVVKKPLLTKWCLDDTPATKEESQQNKRSEETPIEESRSLIALGNPFSSPLPIVLNFNGDEFENPALSQHSIMDFVIDDFLATDHNSDSDDEFETDENRNTKLTKQEQQDLESFNLGIHLEQFRARNDNKFQTQDFSQFVDFEQL